MSRIIVSQPVLSIEGNSARLSSDIILPDGIKQLWFECDAVHADKYATTTCDGFVVAILAFAMRNGYDLCVDGALSSRLYYSLTSYVIEIIRNLIPNTNKINI